MDFLSRYEIPFKGLKEGAHQFDFDIDDKFFEAFDSNLASKGNVKAKVKLTKQSALLILDISVKGSVELMCDRCLEYYDQKVKNKAKLVVKFGNESDELSDELIVVPLDEHMINLAQYLFEQIILSLPIKHVHPNIAKGLSGCNPEMLEKLKEYIVDEKPTTKYEEPVIDERWSELKKLLDNK